MGFFPFLYAVHVRPIPPFPRKFVIKKSCLLLLKESRILEIFNSFQPLKIVGREKLFSVPGQAGTL